MNIRDDELVELNGKRYPVMAARLRQAHSEDQGISITTELVESKVGEYAVSKATVTLEKKGEFSAFGSASAVRDSLMVDALIEISGSRAVCRALRIAGFGVDLPSPEDLAWSAETGQHQPAHRPQLRLVANGGGKAAAASEQPAKIAPRPKGTPASAAQQKAIYALGKRLGLTPDQAVAKVLPNVAARELGIGDASKVIDQLKARAEGNGSGTEANK